MAAAQVPPEHSFVLDDFQQLAIEHLDAGKSVVVAAPTGAGKTVVAEHAVALALAAGTKAFYTTPIKALSNQKYHDLARRHGTASVGLLTGDSSINGEAPVVVMTTEVLRNMVYAASPTLHGLGFVVLDEVHYLQDPYRGPVWEEVIVHTPPGARFVCLSATVSNADELTGWIETVRGPTELVVHDERPVELTNLYMVSDRDAVRDHLIPTLVDGEANPQGHRFTERGGQRTRRRGGPKAQRRRRFATPRRHEVLDALEDNDLLPAINFVFSRAGCDDAAQRMADDGVSLTEPDERDQIRAITEHHARHLTPADRDVLRFDRFVRLLERGVAAHHAGMVPAFKEAVEQCFVHGLVKLVFATETLALGINMPARAVVIERLTKFNGDSHEFLTPLEYTQLTGRAGRRGIDDHGYAIVLWSPHVTFDQVAELASSRSFSLRSVFRPTYNMAVNLVRLHDRKGAHRLLDLSFGQYQADRDLSQMNKRRRRLEADVAEIEQELRAAGIDPDGVPPPPTPEQVQASKPLLEAALAELRPGDIIMSPDAGREDPAAVLSVGYRRGGTVKVRLVARSHRRMTLTTEDFPQPPAVVGSIVLPTPYQPNSGAFQHEVARKLQRARLSKRRRGPDRTATTGSIAEPPGPDQLVPTPNVDPAVYKRLTDRRRQLRRLQQRINGRTNRLARQFDDIVGILQHRGYIADWDTTAYGDMLRGIFHETDLAVAESIRLGLFDDLSGPEVAGLASCFTYEHRGPGTATSPRLRSRVLREKLASLDAVVDDIRASESEAGVTLTREIDPGFMATAAAWAGGEALIDVLDDEEVTGGDFVRQVRQLIDLLRQIGSVAPVAATRAAAHEAATALHRGVVVASNILDERDTSATPNPTAAPAGPHALP